MTAETKAEADAEYQEQGEQEAVDAEIVAEETEPAAEPPQPPEALTEAERQLPAIRENVTVDPATMPSPREWEAMRAMAQTICNTEFVPGDFRGRPEAVLAAILAGRELGIGPMQSLKDIHIIDGRPTLAAHLMMAKLRQGGVVIVDSDSTEERAWIKAKRRDTGEEAEVEWTMADARKAGLDQKANFRKFPADMLWARAVGRLGRRIGSDLLAGMPYTAEEVRDFDNDLDGYGGGYDSHPMEGVHKDTDHSYPVPKSWPKIKEAVLNCDNPDEAWALWEAFLRAATYQQYGQTSLRELPGTEERKVMAQKAAGAVCWMHDNVQPEGGEFRFFGEDLMRQAWAHVLDGHRLEIPDYEPPEPEGAGEVDEEAAEIAREALAGD